jgi:tetratricopeptide (TPR) repeat protein
VGSYSKRHDHLRKAVEDRYRISGRRKLNLHHRLAGWFSKREVDARVAEELPWQWMQAANGCELRASLLDPRLFRQLVAKDKYELLQYWLSLNTTSIAAEYEKVWKSWCRETQNALEGAELAELLGEFLAKAGYYGPFTKKLFRSSVSCKSKVFGAKHNVALKALLGLADLLKDAGKLQEAEANYIEVLEGATGGGQSTEMFLLETQNNLGLLMAERGNHQEAEKLLKACLRGHSDALGECHPRTLATLNNLGILAESRGDFPAAREYYRRAQAGLIASRGDAHPMSLTASGNVASMSDVMGDTSEARVLYTTTHKAFTEVLGAEHPFTLNTVNNLACLEFVSGDSEVAGQLFAGVVSAYRRTLDKNHPLLLKAIDNLGHAWFRAGDLDRAIRHFKEAFEGRRRTLGSGHNDTEASRYNFALSLKKSGKVSRAKKVLLEDGDPSDPNHNYLLARCECQRAHRDDAVRHLKLAFSAKPELLHKALEEQDFNSIRGSVLLEQRPSESNRLGTSKCRPK